ncbi:tetratricopeptide repeat protein [Parasphingorhabdus sp.]|uniref:tetratricopeptide repeat protein n=1 Tax=Parasphingorhabdus sp. TaxID=2709688 RepID=UPI002F94CD84
MILIGLLYAALPPAIQAASNGHKDARTAFTKAKQYESRGDVRSARIEMLNAIKADPEWIDARILQAEILLKLSDGAGAEAELDRAFDLGLDVSQVRHIYGHALQIQGKWDEAKDQLIAEDIPVQHKAYADRILGRVAIQTGDEDLARRAFDRAIRRDAANADLWVDVARFRAGSGDQAGALAAVKEAVRRDPDNIRALQYRGELLRSQYGLAAALPWFERALQIDPNDVPILTEYAATLGDMGRMTDMLAISRKIISLDVSNPRAFYMQAVLAARAGKYDLARMLMQKTEGRLDNVPAVMMMQGIVEFEVANYIIAIDRFHRLVSLQPNNVQAQNLLARSLYLSGDPDGAMNRLQPQVNNSGTASYTLWLAGRALEANDMRQEATGLFNRASRHDAGQASVILPEEPIGFLRSEVEREPDNAVKVIPYIRALYHSGDYSAAFAQAKHLQQGNPGASDAHILVADTAMAMGNFDEALAALALARRIRFSEPVMLRIVEALRAKGDVQGAGAVLAEFLTYNPNNLSALRLMAYGHLEAGNWDIARRILENICKRIGENDVLIMAGLAQAYTELGQTDKAVATARIAYYVQPSSPVASHIYGRALLAEGSRSNDARDLFRKSVMIAPLNEAYRASLALTR